MIRNVISIDKEVGVKKFTLHCEHSASLEHCLEAAKFYESYFLERIKQVEQPKIEENNN